MDTLAYWLSSDFSATASLACGAKGRGLIPDLAATISEIGHRQFLLPSRDMTEIPLRQRMPRKQTNQPTKQHWFQSDFTISKYSASFTKHVFFGLIRQQSCPSWPVIDKRIFYFSPTTDACTSCNTGSIDTRCPLPRLCFSHRSVNEYDFWLTDAFQLTCNPTCSITLFRSNDLTLSNLRVCPDSPSTKMSVSDYMCLMHVRLFDAGADPRIFVRGGPTFL